MMPSMPNSSKAINSLSIVFSFYNEQDVLLELIRRTRLVLQNLQKEKLSSHYELIFVNDASTDNSLPILLEQAKGQDDVRVINMSRQFGVSPCVMAGLAYSSGDAVIYMDADLQDPPELIPRLLDVMRQKNVDVVHTVRESRQGESRLKLFITRIGYLTLNKVSDINLPIEAGDFKLLSRRVVNHLVQLKEHRPFMRGLVCWVGFKQEFVPYTREPRQKGETKFHVLSPAVIDNFFNSALISFSAAPLRLAAYFGLLAIAFDFVLVLHVLFEKFFARAVPGWTAIMIAILFLGGVQLFCIGMVGLYLHSVYEQSKYRPNYIVESTFGFSQDPPKS